MDRVEILKMIFEDAGIFNADTDINRDLELDSLQVINVILGIEDNFLLRVSSYVKSYEELKTFKDYLDLIDSFL